MFRCCHSQKITGLEQSLQEKQLPCKNRRLLSRNVHFISVEHKIYTSHQTLERTLCSFWKLDPGFCLHGLQLNGGLERSASLKVRGAAAIRGPERCYEPAD